MAVEPNSANSNAGSSSAGLPAGGPSASRPAGALINRVLAGRYEILEMIGEGPLLSAFRARDRSLNRVVAMKILLPGTAAAGQTAIVQKLREGLGEVLSLNHANITRSYDVGSDDENGISVFVAEEYVRGIDLKERIRRAAPFQLTAAADCTLAIAEALEFAHARGIAHGDVRPQNILIGPEGQVKLSNFGVAEAQNAAIYQNPLLLQRVVSYIAPDAAASARPTASADLYALGVVLYEMLTGDLPFKGENPVQIALKHAQEPIPSPRTVNLGVPRALEGVVLRALGKRPEERYASATEMLADLREVRDALRYGKSLAWSPVDRVRAASETANPAAVSPAAVQRPAATAAATAAGAGVAASNAGVGDADVDDEDVAGTIVMPGRSIRGAGALEARRSAASPPAKGGAAAVRSGRSAATVAEADDDFEDPRDRRGRNGGGGGGGGGRWLTFVNLFLFLVVLGAIGVFAYYANSYLQPERDVVVPNLVGRSVTDAKTLAITEKFELATVDEQYQDRIPADTIYQQRPAPGYHIRQGKQVSIWVSKGPHMANVPDVHDMAFDRAKRVVESSGLKVGAQTYEYDPIVAKGNVLNQSPQPGEARPRGSGVDLVLSKGEEPTPTPEPIDTPPITPDTGSVPSPDSGASPSSGGGGGAATSGTDDQQQRTFEVGYKAPDDGQPHHVRIDVTDVNGQRTVYDETRQPGEKVSSEVQGVGKNITIKLYDNDVLRSEQTK